MSETDETEVPTRRKPGNPNLKKGGKSLNPKGRTPGSKNRLTELQNTLIDRFSTTLEKDFDKLIKTVVNKAVKGDMVAAKLLLDRAIPARKAVEHYGATEGTGGINIIISGIESDTVTVEPIEAEYKEVTEDERPSD